MSTTIRVSREEIDAVWTALQPHRGQVNAISRQALVTLVGFSDRKIRAVLHELVVTYGRPIGSLSTGGYFVIADAVDAASVAGFYRSYAYELLARAQAVERAFANSQQVALFTEAKHETARGRTG